MDVRMGLEVLLRNAGEKILEHRNGKIARHAANAADDKVTVRRSAARDGLGYQSMG